MRIGFVGVGKMGAPMALRLAGAGHDVRIYDTSQEAVAALAGTANITAAPTLADMARGATVVITMLPDGTIVREVAEQLGVLMDDGAVLVDMSTAYPPQTVDLRIAFPDRLKLVDAPVSGGVWRAELGTLTIMAGGEPDLLGEIADAMAPMGEVVRCGGLGAGHAMKLLNNYLSAAGLAAASEAVLIGRRFGLDPDLMADVFNASTGMNNATKVKLKQHINNQRFGTGFTMALMLKDLTLGESMAQDLGVPAEGLAAAKALFARAVDTLGGNEDHSALIKILDPDRA